MNRADCEIAQFRRIFCNAFRDEAGSLYKIHPIFKRADKARNGLRIIFIIAVNGDNALIALVKRKRISAEQLSANLSRTRLDQKPPYFDLLQRSQFQGAVCASPSTMRISAIPSILSAAILDNRRLIRSPSLITGITTHQGRCRPSQSGVSKAGTCQA